MTDERRLYEHGSVLKIKLNRTYQAVVLTYLRAYETREEAAEAMRAELDRPGIDKAAVERVEYRAEDVGDFVARLHESVEEWRSDIRLTELDAVLSVHLRNEEQAGVDISDFAFCADAELRTWVKPCIWLPITQNYPAVNGCVKTRREYIKCGLASIIGIDAWLRFNGNFKHVVEVERVARGDYRMKT